MADVCQQSQQGAMMRRALARIACAWLVALTSALAVTPLLAQSKAKGTKQTPAAVAPVVEPPVVAPQSLGESLGREGRTGSEDDDTTKEREPVDVATPAKDAPAPDTPPATSAAPTVGEPAKSEPRLPAVEQPKFG